jgi:lysyl oxidase
VKHGTLVRIVPAALAIAAMVPAALAANGSQPHGARLLPDLDQEAPTGLIITSSHNRWNLGFNSAASNVGSGPLIITGHRPSHAQKTMTADQTIDLAAGPSDVVHGTGHLRYVKSVDHQHWHLLHFERYTLRRVGSKRPAVRDHKSGFCLGDRYAVPDPPVLPARVPEKVYRGACGLERPGLLGVKEGISVGWGDDYAANLEGQYLRLSHLRAGRYLLVHRVNADHTLLESSYANNAASLLLRLRWRQGIPRIRILAVCPDSARCRAGH